MNSKPQVLVVEDLTLDELVASLRSDEYDLTGVRSLEQAIAALEPEQQAFDVVVTDLELFEHSDGGIQVVKKAKSRDATTAVFMVTSYSDGTTAGHVIHDLGAEDFFPKPLDVATCRQRISKAIKERRRRLTAIKAADEKGFVELENPYVAGKALDRGNTMFYGRDQVFDFIRDSIRGPKHNDHLALIGPSRIGKTSILKQLPERWDSSCFLPVYIDCQSLGIGGMPAFFLQLASLIRRSLKEQAVDTASLPTFVPTDLGKYPAPALDFYYKFFTPLDQNLGKCKLVLCLDEFEELVGRVQRGDLDSTVFGLLYNMMQDEAIVCILVGTRRLPELGKTSRSTDKVVEWVDQIIEMVTFQRIGLLPPDLACRLIEEPVEHSRMRYQAAAIQAILSATGGYPYLIQLLCGKLVSRRNEQRQNEMTVDDVQFAIEALLETTQPGFFWKRLTPHQQIVLIAACQLWQDQQIVTAHDVEAQLQTLEVPWQNWKTPVRSLLRELALEELLQGKGKGRHFEYRLTFELLSAWVRRHKTLDQIREEMDHDA